MKKLTVLFLLMSTIGFSQDIIERELGVFDKVKVFNGLKVTLKKADTPSIEISGDKASEVVVKNVNGLLKLSMRFSETFSAKEAAIILYYTEDLYTIDVNEGAIVTSKERVVQDKVELKAQEGAIINLDLDVSYLTVRTVTGGKITTKGNADNQDIEANTGGFYKAYDLEANSTTIVSSSGAVVEVRVSKLLDVKIRLGGAVFYKGNPEEIKTEKIIGGTIKSKD